jgi:hypothetical protein
VLINLIFFEFNTTFRYQFGLYSWFFDRKESAMALKRWDAGQLSGYETSSGKLNGKSLDWALRLGEILDAMPFDLELVTDSDGSLFLVDRDLSADIEDDGSITAFFGSGAVLATFSETHIHAANKD